MEKIISLIKEIVKHHPGYGVERGWSTYTGGIKDSGYWYWNKMVDVREKELEVFLEYLKDEDIKVQEAFEERQRINALPQLEKEAIWKKEQERERDFWKDHQQRMESFLMWGKETKKSLEKYLK